MRKAAQLFTVLIISLSLKSCGYRWTDPSSCSIGLVFIDKDEYGYLSQRLIEQIAQSGLYTYCNTNYTYLLTVEIEDMHNETIGYRRDKEKDVSIRENIIADEGRVYINASIEITDPKKQKTILTPTKVTAFVDYDYVDENSLQDLSFVDSNGTRRTVLLFSLGQLESEYSAQSDALKPLYDQLAQKIVDVISSKMIED